MEGSGSGMPDTSLLEMLWPNSMKQWWSKVPAWKPQWNAHKVRFFDVVASCCSGFMVAQACCSVKECLYGSQLQSAECVAAVSRQFCIVVVSCCSGSMDGQLLYSLGCWLWVFACDSERISRCGKSPTNNIRDLTSFPVYEEKFSLCTTHRNCEIYFVKGSQIWERSIDIIGYKKG